ncbi:putative ANTH domain-containing protein [Medicago truncatula]|uniref:Clathrin assembly protein n=1 Tax=Medicago truncatula TaxID=3880 RepID=G7J7A9_MEDTR|nr:clathrin coat assembly protein AP180 [Medicago truncatula]AES71669.1 clathrin assembly protein [Medicago truncatula]RHN68960.1 putative ANTH domain-containing protein [Medicago truncatula]
MPSKLRKAIGAVKDQTSISLAKVTHAANLEVTILKATTHDKNPIEERYVNEIVNIVSSNKAYAAACAQCIGKRMGKTRNWVVALKSLMIVLRIFQDGDPYFPREVFHSMKRGAKILNLSSFKDDSNSSPWDYTAFIRTFALYLDERLDCFLTGKLQRRFTYNNRFHEKNQRNEPGIRDMKPTLVLNRITYWQRLLDRAIGTRPTGAAKNNRLVQISLYAVVQESFDLYKDISDGLGVVLDNFFNLPLSACVTAFNACVKSYKQFDELSAFYSFCLNIGIGRSYEYPSVQKVSEELMETLQAFLKDQASFHNTASKHFILSAQKKSNAGLSSSQDELGTERCGTLDRYFETGSEFGSQCTSLEDLMSATDVAESSRGSIEHDRYSEESDEKHSLQYDDGFGSANGSGSVRSSTIDKNSRSSFDIVSVDDMHVQQNHQTKESSKDCWEIVLAKTITNETPSPKLENGFDSFDKAFDQALVPHQKYNPFLEDIGTLAPHTNANDNFDDAFGVSPTFKATPSPTFNAHDPLASSFSDQNSNSLTNLDLIFGDINPNDTTVAPTFKAQQSFNHGSAPTFQAQHSFKNGSTPTFQVHNSNDNAIIESPIENPNTSSIVPLDSHNSFYNSTVVPTFQAQHSFKNGSIPTFQAQHSFRNGSTPIFRAQHSFKSGSTPTFQVHNSNDNDIAESPTNIVENPNTCTVPFDSHNSFYNSTVPPTFQAQHSFRNGSTPTFQAQPSFKHDSTPTFQAQHYFKNRSTPNFQVHNSNDNAIEESPTYNIVPNISIVPFDSHNSFYNSTVAPTFQAQHSFRNDSTPSFQAQHSFRNGSTSTFQVHNSNDNAIVESTTYTIESPNTSIVPFDSHNSFYNSTIAPTFSANGGNEITSATQIEDDLFGPWPSATTNDPTSNVSSMQDQTLLQFQQLWLEQQNKIIAKHMT